MKKLIFYFILANISSLVTAQDFKTYDQDIPGTATTFKMAAIQPGKFKIGSPVSERNRGTDEGPQKQIEIAPF